MKFIQPTFKLIMLTLIVGVTFYSCEKDLTLSQIEDHSKNGVSESSIAIAKLINENLKNHEFRTFLYDQIGKKFDGDYNVLINDLIDRSPVLKHDFDNLDIEIDPLLQVAIPINYSKLSGKTIPTVFIIPDLPDEEISNIYKLKDGNLEDYDVKKVPVEPVIVINLNERVTINPDNEEYIVDKSYQYYDRLLENAEEVRIHTRGGSPGGPCNYGRDGYMYLVGLRSTDLAGIEPWILGKPELRLNIMASENEYLAQQGDGNNILKTFYKPDRGDIEPGWMYVNDYLFYWPEIYPENVTFKWVEEDGGVFSQDTENITVQWGSNTYSVTAPEFLKPNHDLIHETIVPMGNYCNFDYGNAHLNFKLAKYD